MHPPRMGLTALAAVALGSLVWIEPAPAAQRPTCAELGTNPAYDLAGNPQISNLSVQLEPATPVSAAYCQVNFTFSGESGPEAGYLAGQNEQIRIRVGLPLNSRDGGTGGLEGAWTGRNRDLGGGGYAGAVGGVTSSTNRGYVGTSTDTGHSTPGGSFALNPDHTLNWGLIRDFARDGIRQQHLWGVRLAKGYYGMDPRRTYWMGCSTGGRQGHYQAQNFPDGPLHRRGGPPRPLRRHAEAGRGERPPSAPVKATARWERSVRRAGFRGAGTTPPAWPPCMMSVGATRPCTTC
jgi:feruloyl esterase